MEVTVHEAKTQLSRLLKLAEDGETVTILRRGVPSPASLRFLLRPPAVSAGTMATCPTPRCAR
jgi:hypothetical protein